MHELARSEYKAQNYVIDLFTDEARPIDSAITFLANGNKRDNNRPIEMVMSCCGMSPVEVHICALLDGGFRAQFLSGRMAFLGR